MRRADPLAQRATGSEQRRPEEGGLWRHQDRRAAVPERLERGLERGEVMAEVEQRRGLRRVFRDRDRDRDRFR